MARTGPIQTDTASPPRGKRRKPARAEPTPLQVAVRPVAGPARARPRHWAILAAFVAIVVVPALVAAWYLWGRAADQYASTTGFTVRHERTSTPEELLGGLSALTGASSASSDSDILYEFIQSQELVRRIDADLDLRAIYSRPWPDDRVFGLDPDASIEELTAYWQRMVRISYEPGSGLMELRVLAFTPAEATAVAEAVVDESSEMINALSDKAQADATRYAEADLDEAVADLKDARQAMTTFRSRTQIVDPEADVQGQVGLLNNLQSQLASALIELDTLRRTASDDDPRIARAERRIEVIRDRIADERGKFGAGGPGGGAAASGDRDYASLVARYESLSVDLRIAEEAYTAARSAYESAQAEAKRQSRYLAAYMQPTRAEIAQYPQRWMLLGLAALFLTLAWAIVSLVYYSLRDRR